ncbi:UNVERIFIED_CONTAM: hypothetical protein K2H54_041720 [Gekko kuhli]
MLNVKSVFLRGLHTMYTNEKFEYIVEYDYDAVHDDELTIRVGEVLRNVKRLEEEGWLEGELNGKRGVFPDNFVKASASPSPQFFFTHGRGITLKS